MNLNDTIPAISFHATNNTHGNLNDFLGKWLILYFYPKDSTPGCTLEGQDFRDNFQAFEPFNALIFGVSRDSLKSHENFKTKQQFPFELISDTDEKICQTFDVIKLKNLYGKSVRGIERSTFLIDPNGKIAHIWRGVKVKAHVLDVLKTLNQLTQKNQST